MRWRSLLVGALEVLWDAEWARKRHFGIGEIHRQKRQTWNGTLRFDLTLVLLAGEQNNGIVIGT